MQVRVIGLGPVRLTPARRGVVMDSVAQLLRQNGLFAVSEISKGVVILGVGDIATADAVGELVSCIQPSAGPLVAILSLRPL